jgi:AhpD family alkylhydroperoxidase
MTGTETGAHASSTPQIPVRLDFDTEAAGFARALNHLDHAATKELDRAGIDPLLRELIRVRASQLNGCAYCIDMHTKDARAAGETEQRLYALPAWRETPFFTERERAALAFTEDVTLLAGEHVPAAAYDSPGGSHRHHQRLERDRPHHPRLAPWLLPALTRGGRPVAVRSRRVAGT